MQRTALPPVGRDRRRAAEQVAPRQGRWHLRGIQRCHRDLAQMRTPGTADGAPSLLPDAEGDATRSPIVAVGAVDATVGSDAIDVVILVAQRGS